MQEFLHNKSPSVTYFDSAGKSVLPLSVEKVGIMALCQKATPWNGVGSDSDVDEVREHFASIIGTSPKNIALCPSTGFALSMCAANLTRLGILTEGSHVLLVGKDMGSDIYPWQHACQKTGAILKVIDDPVPTSTFTGTASSFTDAVTAAINENVKVVALPNVHWCTGALIDLSRVAAKIASFPETRRPLFVVDGTQSVGALPINVKDLDCDFLACSVHKWLNGPYGMSLVYVHPKWLSNWEPLDQHERGRVGSNEVGWDEVIFMDKDTGFYPSAFFPDARRLDAGGKPNPITIPMLKQALSLVRAWDPVRIHAQVTALTDALVRELDKNFNNNAVHSNHGRTTTHLLMHKKESRGGHILGIRFHPQSEVFASLSLMKVYQALKLNGVHIAVRGEWLRISPYIHNTVADVHRFVSLFALIVTDLVRAKEEVGLDDSRRPLRVLVTGAAGWLGQFTTHALLPFVVNAVATLPTDLETPRINLFVAYHSAVPHWIPAGERRVCVSLEDPVQVEEALSLVQPDIILHIAALSSPATCHQDRARAHVVNCPTALVDAARRLVPHCNIVFTSTDMVYDGEKAPYVAATSPTVPVNVYGESKWMFERYLRAQYPAEQTTVLRLSNMIGPPHKYQNAGGKFLEWVNTACDKREFVGFKTNEVRSFVFVADVVELFLRIVKDGWVARRGNEIAQPSALAGVFNVGGPSALSRMQLAERLCAARHVALTVVDQSVTKPESGSGEAVDDVAEWKVYIMESAAPSLSPSPTTLLGGVEHPYSQLVSPRDIGMDSTTTEVVFGKQFTALTADVLLHCLSV